MVLVMLADEVLFVFKEILVDEVLVDGTIVVEFKVALVLVVFVEF